MKNFGQIAPALQLITSWPGALRWRLCQGAVGSRQAGREDGNRAGGRCGRCGQRQAEAAEREPGLTFLYSH